MDWEVRVAETARKQLVKLPTKEQNRLFSTITEMSKDPWAGDIIKIKGEENAWRRRTGNYRIFYDINKNIRTIDIYEIQRRTSTTYRR